MSFLFAGLGNPGSTYVGTRHNVGRDFLLAIAHEAGFGTWKKDTRSNALVSSGSLFGEGGETSRVSFILPETFMNRSGEALKIFSRKRGILPEHIVLIHDDIDLPIGKVRISKGRGAGGHNGAESVIHALGTKGFIRIRIGICPADETRAARKPAKEAVGDYVLGRFLPDEEVILAGALKKTKQAMGLIVEEGILRAMERTNCLE